METYKITAELNLEKIIAESREVAQTRGAGLKSYLRFGDVPKDKISKVHRSDAVIRNEAGVSVWNCVFVNDVPFPLLPQNASESAMADYFYMLLGNKPVYLVEGSELEEKGSAGEPLLDKDIKVIKEYTADYEYLKAIHRR